MRAVLLLLILVVVVAIGAIATGFININQVRPADAPEIQAGRDGIAVTGGQAPAFDVETGKIAVGTQERTVKLPGIEVRPADGNAAAGNTAGGVNQPARQGGQASEDVATTDATQP